MILIENIWDSIATEINYMWYSGRIREFIPLGVWSHMRVHIASQHSQNEVQLKMHLMLPRMVDTYISSPE